MQGFGNPSRKRGGEVPATELPRSGAYRLRGGLTREMDLSPKKYLSTVESELPFEYYNNYPKSISKTSNMVSSLGEDEYHFDIEEPLRFLDTESEANHHNKSDNLTAIEEVETKGEELNQRESMIFSGGGEDEEGVKEEEESN